MRGDVVFLALPLLVAVAGSVLLWTGARTRRRRTSDDHGHLRAFRRRAGSTPPKPPGGIVSVDADKK